jgi:probable lipoprotein NlpC
MRFWFMLAAALILAGCSSHRAPPPNPRLADSITVVANLNEQLRSWRGAPYRYGGMTPRGVDCSGFVVRTFRDKFALQLPRETREQAEIGTRIDKRDLLPGDLVFFKTGSGRAVCTSASTIPTTSLSMPPPARASPVPRWITSTGTKSSGRRGVSDVIQKQEGSERFLFYADNPALRPC